MHNTHICVDDRTFMTVALVAGGRLVQKRVRSHGLLKLTCDAHPLMQGFVMVFDHDLVATTNALGLFSVTGVPPASKRSASGTKRWGRSRSK
jgi:hypothetical protein